MTEEKNTKTKDTELAAETNKTQVVADRSNYKETRSASGAKSLNNGDPIAEGLDGMTIHELFNVGQKVCGEDFKPKYAHLNVGMQRMNVGNRIRGAVTKLNKAGAKPVEGETADPEAGTNLFNKAICGIRKDVAARAAKAASKAKAAEAAKAEAADAETKEAKPAEGKTDKK